MLCVNVQLYAFPEDIAPPSLAVFSLNVQLYTFAKTSCETYIAPPVMDA